jgi:hypothetical protein
LFDGAFLSNTINNVVDQLWQLSASDNGVRDVNWLSMSVAKSFISALVGIAIEEGHINSIEDPVTKYDPGLLGSAYDNVSIKDILQMSSGARWNEDYSVPNSDIGRQRQSLARGGIVESVFQHADTRS